MNFGVSALVMLPTYSTLFILFVVFALSTVTDKWIRYDISVTMERNMDNLVLIGTIEEIQDLTLFGVNMETGDDVLNQKVSGKEFGFQTTRLTPVLLAVIKGNVDVLEWLLQQGADIGRHNQALILASQFHQAKMIDFLMHVSNANEELIFDVNYQSSAHKTTPLIAAMRRDTFATREDNFNERAFRDTLEILIDKYNANVNLQGRDGRTALMVGLQRKKRQLFASYYQLDNLDEIMCKKIKLLLSIGEGKINVNIQDKNGATAVIYAVEKGLIDLLPILKDQGADFRIEDKKGHNPLNTAANMYHTKIMEYLLDENIFDINEKDSVTGDTSLMVAMNKNNYLLTWREQENMLSLLLNKNADVNATNKHGETALMLGIESCNLDGLKILLSKAGDIIDVNARDNRAENAAMKLVSVDNGFNSVEIWKLLRENNVDVNVRTGNAILLQAMIRNNESTIEYLMSERLTEVSDDVDASTLMISSKDMNIEVLKLLLRKVGDTIDYGKHLRKCGETAVMEALKNSRDETRAVDVLKLLRQHNADFEGQRMRLFSRAPNGTLLVIAASMGYSRVTDY